MSQFSISDLRQKTNSCIDQSIRAIRTHSLLLSRSNGMAFLSRSSSVKTALLSQGIADMLLPPGEPPERLEDGALRRALKRRPFGFEACEIIAQLERDARACIRIDGLDGERRTLPARQVAGALIERGGSVGIVGVQSRFALAREQGQRRVVVEHANSLRYRDCLDPIVAPKAE